MRASKEFDMIGFSQAKALHLRMKNGFPFGLLKFLSDYHKFVTNPIAYRPYCKMLMLVLNCDWVNTGKRRQIRLGLRP